jgi:hypothetical protein
MERSGDEPDRVSEADVRKPDIDEAFRGGRAIDGAVGRAVREALRMHKRLGNPIALGENGRVCWIPPEEIDLDE